HSDKASTSRKQQVDAAVSAVVGFLHGAAKIGVPRKTGTAIGQNEVAPESVDLFVVESVPRERGSFDRRGIVDAGRTDSAHASGEINLEIAIAGDDLIL